MIDPETARKDAEHLRLLVIFHKVLAGIVFLFGCLPIIHFVVGLIFFVGGLTGSKSGDMPPAFFGLFFMVFAGAMILAYWAGAGLAYHAGNCLERRARYTYCMVVAALSCLFMPIGTVLGVFTIIVLARPSVKALFESGGADPLRLEVDGLFRAVADSGAEAGAKALLRLAELCRGGQRAAVAYYAFRPTPSGTVLGHRWGRRVLARAAPNIIEMMGGPLAAPAEELLRAVQGRSPAGSGRESWQKWWNETGRALFENAGAGGDDVIRPCPPECPTCRACERRDGIAAR